MASKSNVTYSCERTGEVTVLIGLRLGRWEIVTSELKIRT